MRNTFLSRKPGAQKGIPLATRTMNTHSIQAIISDPALLIKIIIHAPVDRGLSNYHAVTMLPVDPLNPLEQVGAHVWSSLVGMSFGVEVLELVHVLPWCECERPSEGTIYTVAKGDKTTSQVTQISSYISSLPCDRFIRALRSLATNISLTVIFRKTTFSQENDTFHGEKLHWKDQAIMRTYLLI